MGLLIVVAIFVLIDIKECDSDCSVLLLKADIVHHNKFKNAALTNDGVLF